MPIARFVEFHVIGSPAELGRRSGGPSLAAWSIAPSGHFAWRLAVHHCSYHVENNIIDYKDGNRSFCETITSLCPSADSGIFRNFFATAKRSR